VPIASAGFSGSATTTPFSIDPTKLWSSPVSIVFL